MKYDNTTRVESVMDITKHELLNTFRFSVAIIVSIIVISSEVSCDISFLISNFYIFAVLDIITCLVWVWAISSKEAVRSKEKK